jgi:Dolichyl-phosphate-mannose-protein mannosyltransferase
MSTTAQQLAASVRVRALPFLSRIASIRAILLVLIAIACGLAASTYSVFGHTWDEPEHLAAGMNLIDTGDYQYDTQHPPLARIAMAIGPYLAGARSYGNPGPSGEEEGRDILYGEHYDLYLTLARVGMLPFLALLLFSVWAWTRHTYGTPTAILATAIVVATPVIIGHAAVATLDIPMVGTSLFALYLLVLWFDAPSSKKAIAFGLAAGLAAGAKLSSIPFIGLVAIVWSVIWAVNRRYSNAQQHSSTIEKPIKISRAISHAVIAGLVALCALVLCYGIGVAPFSPEHSVLVPIGIPRLMTSLAALTDHNSAGHLSYFMGELRRSGWWNFYLVALALKTPLPLLLTSLGGTAWLIYQSIHERRWTLMAPPVALIAILIFCSAYSHINIGVRHVLILYPLMAITGAAFVTMLWHRFKRSADRIVIAAIVGWQLLNAAQAHPDYLAYFNEIAGAHPERYLIDSDLDWGQDLRRLKHVVAEKKIDKLAFIYRGTADLVREGLPQATLLWPNQRASGWIAVSLLARATGSESGGYDWLKAHKPTMRIGKSIDLYYVEPNQP